MTTMFPLESVRVVASGPGAALTSCVRLLGQLGARTTPLPPAAPSDAPTSLRAIVSPIEVVLEASADASGQPPSYSSTGAPATHPIQPFLGALDPRAVATLTGAHAAVALLAATRHVRLHDSNIEVAVGESEVAAACQGERFAAMLCPRASGAPAYDASFIIVPCSDGHVGVSVGSPDDRASLAALVGLTSAPPPDWEEAIRCWTATRSRAAIFEEAQLWRLPLVPALTPSELHRDPQCLARSVWCAGTTDPASPFRLSCNTAMPGHGRTARTKPRPTGDQAPLAGVRVLDLGMMWAGPYAGRLLAGLGAEVVKVEGPRRPDGTRRQDGACQGLFADLNRGKRSLVLDLASAAGRQVFLRLVAEVDIVIDNFSPRVMPNFELGPAVLAATNPSVISVSLPAFGTTGPWANYVAYGSGLELATGLAHLGADGRPVVAEVPYLDYLAGLYGAAGALAALLGRDESGVGCHLEIAQREIACQLLAMEASVRKDAASAPPLREVRPHLAALGLIADPPRTREPCHHLARLPWRLLGLPDRQESDAPQFGADSATILRELGHLSPSEVEDLGRAGVICQAAGGMGQEDGA